MPDTPSFKRRFVPKQCADVDFKLQEEAVLLGRIHYRCRSQHRGSLYLQQLEQVEHGSLLPTSLT